MMNVWSWYQTRGPGFILHRGQNLWERYGFSVRRAEVRIEECLARLAAENCSPTFPVPGMVLEKHPQFITHLAKIGAEIAVHGYNHIDLKSCSSQQAGLELLRAVETFNKFGLQVHGFRCPYLSYSDELLHALPDGIFKYSSNRAIRWEGSQRNLTGKNRIVETLDRFYSPLNSKNTVCVPWMTGSLVEIPVCIPDDLQLIDGYHLNPDQLITEWGDVLRNIHSRGELFTLMFHPELFNRCIGPLINLLRAARNCWPKIWVARLADISDWWLEKKSFKVDIESADQELRLNFSCTPRATILIRDLSSQVSCQKGNTTPWEGSYSWLRADSITIPASQRPFIGIAPDFPVAEKSFLEEQGYILDDSTLAEACTIFIDRPKLARFLTPSINQAAGAQDDSDWTIIINRHALLEWIEGTPGPLVRYWRWPDGYKSVLSLSGDLDALSLLDYSSRLFSGRNHLRQPV